MEITILDPGELRSWMERIESKVDAFDRKIFPQQRQWYDLRAACERKGLNLNTARSKPKLQPNGGIEDARIAGKKSWRRATIQRWLEETDESLN